MELLEKNLKDQTERKKREILNDIAKSVSNVLKNHGLNTRRTLSFKFAEEHDYEFGPNIKASIVTKEQEQRFTEEIEGVLFSDFKNTLKKFAWAFRNTQ